MIDIDKITVENLNELTCTQVSLILLRCLNTSDLTFMHALFKPETLKDIVDVTTALVNGESEAAINHSLEVMHFVEERAMIQRHIDIGE